MKVGLFDVPTAQKVLDSLKKANSGRPASTGSRMRRDAPDNLTMVAKVIAEISDGYYTFRSQIIDDTDSDKEQHTWTDAEASSGDFTGYETSGTTGIEVGKVFRLWNDVNMAPGTNHIWLFQLGGGGSSTPISTPYVGQEFGGTYDFPGGSFTAFTETTNFYISTPWGSRTAIPSTELAHGYRGLASKIGNAYYLDAKNLYIKPTQVYPTSGNLTDFEIYFAKSDSSLLLGVAGFSLPLGAEATVEDYDNTISNLGSRTYFNEKMFECSYDPAQNLFLIDHPIFGV